MRRHRPVEHRQQGSSAASLTRLERASGASRGTHPLVPLVVAQPERNRRLSAFVPGPLEPRHPHVGAPPEAAFPDPDQHDARLSLALLAPLPRACARRAEELVRGGERPSSLGAEPRLGAEQTEEGRRHFLEEDDVGSGVAHEGEDGAGLGGGVGRGRGPRVVGQEGEFVEESGAAWRGCGGASGDKRAPLLSVGVETVQVCGLPRFCRVGLRRPRMASALVWAC